MKSSVFFLAASATALLTASCNRQADGENDAAERSLTFDAYTCQISNELTGSAADYYTEKDIVYTDSVSLVLPRTVYGKDMAVLRDNILKMAFDTIGTDLNSVVDEFVRKDASQFTYTPKKVPSVNIYEADGFELISGTVINLTPDLLVYEVTNSALQPRGANGLTTRFYINYDLDASRVIDGAFLFNPSARKDLVKLIAARADEMTEIIGPTNVEELPENDNLYINSNGEIVFVYQPYEIASHAQGLISIPFYPYELTPYLTGQASAYFHLDDLNE